MKKYWQTSDSTGEECTFFKEKPRLMSNGAYINNDEYVSFFLFPIPLKPLQIAEITINEDGTWWYETEREDGWYAGKKKDSIANPYDYPYFFQYENGKFMIDRSEVLNIDEFEISYKRIPDECFLK